MAITMSFQQSRYPRAFEFLAKELPLVRTKHPDAWSALKQYSNLNDSEALEAVTLNSSPPIILGSTLGLATYGVFRRSHPARIEISTRVFEQFDQDADKESAQQFLLAKVLHEICHWGCFRKGVADNDQAGEDFEIKVFGQELAPWWAVPGPELVPDVDAVFSDPVARAQACIRLLSTPDYVAGKLEDPHQRVFGGGDVEESLSRGYRNNNPGNIRISSDMWKGLADPVQKTAFQQREKSFCVFREPEWGLRAIAILLKNYKHIHGLVTPRSIISRWAPASDNNNVVSYSSALAKALGTVPDGIVDADDDDTLIKMMRAIARHENDSKVPYGDVQFRAALLLI